MDEMQLLRRTTHKIITSSRSGSYSPPALRYTIRKIDELIAELQACRDFLKVMG
jgi:hypothetical protein